jgi:putative membrane protein
MRITNKTSVKLIAAILSVLIFGSAVAVAAYSAGADSAVKKSESVSEKQDDDSSVSEGGELSKNESVYVIADAVGEPEKIIVSDWIKNPDKLAKINDSTNLKDIKNVKGDEKFTMNDDNMCVWDAEGKDIYYQGNGTDALPVDLSVSYILDNRAVTPEQIKGKSGRLTIRFDYKNKKYETVKINGKDERIYVPFVMLTGMMLDNEKFSNVQVSNGKVINDGNRTIVAGFALPGLSDSLNINRDKLDIPDYVEITADVKEFELTSTLTLATNDVFSDIDFTDADEEIENLDKKLDTLTDATDKLIDGSSQLYKGIDTLLKKSGDLISGVRALASGAKKLAGGAAQVDSGAGTLKSGAKTLNSGAVSLKDGTAQLKDGITQLSSGLGTISSNSSKLNDGAKQVFESLLKTADASIAAAGIKAEKLTIDNYASVLKKISDSLSEDSVKKLAYNTALDTVTTTVRSQESMVRASVEEAVKQKVLAGVLEKAGMNMTPEQYTAACAAGRIPQENQQQISAAVDAQMQTNAIKATVDTETEAQIQKLIDDNMKTEKVQSGITDAVNKAKSGKTSISTLKEQLDSYNAFYNGLISYTSGVDKAKSGAAKLVSGSTQLSGGTEKLAKGTKKLKSGTKTLKKGTKTLNNGAKTLSDNLNKLSAGTVALAEGVEKLRDGSLKINKGLKQYKEEGVDLLVDAVDKDVKGLVERFKAVSKVSRHYKSYSSPDSDMKGNVDFIYKTASQDE